jgi:hypothetical protein
MRKSVVRFSARIQLLKILESIAATKVRLEPKPDRGPLSAIAGGP